MLTLFPSERILTQSDNQSITLTTHRILYEYKEWGRSYNQNIMLEHITSSENHNRSSVLSLVLSILFLIIAAFGLINQSDEATILFGLLGLFFLWLYSASRKNLIIISSPSTRMVINAGKMRRENVLQFINKVEQAKNTRIVELGNKSVY